MKSAEYTAVDNVKSHTQKLGKQLEKNNENGNKALLSGKDGGLYSGGNGGGLFSGGNNGVYMSEKDIAQESKSSTERGR